MAVYQPVKLFISYSHKDEALRTQLDIHLALLKRDEIIDSWNDRKIMAGADWSQEIDTNLETAEIILILISPDFLASDYCYDVEMKRAIERHESGTATVIPILLRPCDTATARFMRLQGLPKNFKPVTEWSSQDQAFTDIALGIRKIAERIRDASLRPPRIDAPGALTLFNVPVARNPFFTGREELFEQIHSALDAQHELVIKPARKAAALSGLGGVGKTQTVAEYAHRYQSDYSAVFWVLADGNDLLHTSFSGLAGLLGYTVEKQEEQILAVQSWLSSHDNWLLIFDNAETLELLTAAQELLPLNLRGHVLFTTRAQATGALASVSVDCFDNETGALFLLRRTKTVELSSLAPDEIHSLEQHSEWAVAIDVVKELGGLALAIDQAGAYIEQTGCGLKGYLQRYLADAPAMLKKRGYVQSADHPEAAYRTFLLAMESTRKRSELAYEILLDSALLHPDGISEKLYADCDALELDMALETLKDYSLIKRVPDKQMFTIHRVVQVVIKDVCDG